jgi:hypothetical protein
MGKQNEPFQGNFASCARHAALDAQVLQDCRDDPRTCVGTAKASGCYESLELNHVRGWNSMEVHGFRTRLADERLSTLCGIRWIAHPACVSISHAEEVSVLVA